MASKRVDRDAARRVRRRDERGSGFGRQRRILERRGRRPSKWRTHGRFRRRASLHWGRGAVDWRCRYSAARLPESGGDGDCMLGAVRPLRRAVQQLVAGRERLQERHMGVRQRRPVRPEREPRPPVQKLVQRRAAHAVLLNRQTGLHRQTRRLSRLWLHAGRRLLLLVHLLGGHAVVRLLSHATL